MLIISFYIAAVIAGHLAWFTWKNVDRFAGVADGTSVPAFFGGDAGALVRAGAQATAMTMGMFAVVCTWVMVLQLAA